MRVPDDHQQPTLRQAILQQTIASALGLTVNAPATTAPDADQLRDALAMLLGEPVRDLRSLGGGSTSETFAFSADQHDLVVKTNVNPVVLGRAAHNLAVLAELGIPVPTVVAYDDSLRYGPLAMLVMTRLGGRDLGLALPGMSRAQMSAVAAQIVEMQRRVSTLPANTGFGYVGIGEIADRSWLDVVRFPSSTRLEDPWPVDCVELIPRVHAAIDLAEPYLNNVKPTCFLDDVTTKNVLIEDGILIGVVDFDVVCYGDSLFQIGLTAASISANFPTSCAFYIDELIRMVDPSDVERAILALYEAVFLTEFVAVESPTIRQPLGPGEPAELAEPWRVRAITTANHRLDEVESFFAR